MSLLPLGNPLQKIWYYIPHSLHPLPPSQGGGEGRGAGGSYTHVPCPFGALLVTLYHFSKGFLNGKRNIRGGGQPAGLAAAQKETLYQEMV
jgi:hypothetical protein